MITMRQSFYSITASIIFSGFGIFFACAASYNWQVLIDAWKMPSEFSWGVAGLMFLMAYFSLAHLKHK